MLGMLRQKRGKFKVFLTYTVNSEPDWTTYKNDASKLNKKLSEKKILGVYQTIKDTYKLEIFSK